MKAIRQEHRRDGGDIPFVSNQFYLLSNNNQPTLSLASGLNKGSGNGSIILYDLGQLSSTNWQLFHQGGRYFIRNYDYGSGMQLGVTEQDSTPRMYNRTGRLEQQWSIITVNDGFKLTNGFLGNSSSYNLPSNLKLPAMRSQSDGDSWSITVNPSAAKLQPLVGDWVSEVKDFEIPPGSPTPSPSASTTSITRSTATASFTAPILTVPTSGTTNPDGSNSSNLPQPSQDLSAGAIAGIAIGAVVFVSALGLALWFFCFFRKRRNPHQHAYEVHGEPKIVLEKYAHHGSSELATPPVELPGKEHSHVELESPGRRTP